MYGNVVCIGLKQYLDSPQFAIPTAFTRLGMRFAFAGLCALLIRLWWLHIALNFHLHGHVFTKDAKVTMRWIQIEA